MILMFKRYLSKNEEVRRPYVGMVTTYIIPMKENVLSNTENREG